MARAEPLQVEVLASTRGWAPSARRIGAWAAGALGRRGAGKVLAVRVVGAREGLRLNERFRGKARPTNVLSFPARAPQLPPGAAEPGLLGDLVICAPVVAREARAQGKPLGAHWAHLVVHGSLHLVGYDHESGADARRMERRERSVLARFGIPDPYAPAGVARARVRA
jgi:probable rRNA maturation factor